MRTHHLRHNNRLVKGTYVSGCEGLLRKGSECKPQFFQPTPSLPGQAGAAFTGAKNPKTQNRKIGFSQITKPQNQKTRNFRLRKLCFSICKKRVAFDERLEMLTRSAIANRVVALRALEVLTGSTTPA